MRQHQNLTIELVFSLIIIQFFILTGMQCTQRQLRVPDDVPIIGIEENRRKKETGENEHHKNLFGDVILVQSPVHSFYIDKFEVSELALGDFFSVRNQIPRVQITMEEAKNICRRHSKRLCTLYEWRYACLGIHHKKYGYGNQIIPRRCNIQSERALPAGEKKECQTDTGIHDMPGNVMEWVVSSQHGENIAMGGSFLTGKNSDCFTEFYFPLRAKNNQIGFRCCH